MSSMRDSCKPAGDAQLSYPQQACLDTFAEMRGTRVAEKRFGVAGDDLKGVHINACWEQVVRAMRVNSCRRCAIRAR